METNPKCPVATAPAPAGRKDLDELERLRLGMSAAGAPLELWEALHLARGGACREQTSLTGERDTPAGSGPVPLSGTMAHRLKSLRETLGPLARGLRFLLERILPTLDVACAELVIGEMLLSEQARAEAWDWLTQPDRHLPEASGRLEHLASEARKRLEAFRQGRQAAWESSLREAIPGADGAPPAPAEVLNPKMLEELRACERCSTVLGDGLFHVEPWELHLLMATEGDPSRTLVEAVLRCDDRREAARMDELAVLLLSQVIVVRMEWGSCVQKLRSMLWNADGRKDWKTLDLAVSLLIGAPAGRERARHWMDAPDVSAEEAHAYLRTVWAIARRYRDELEAPPVPTRCPVR